MTNNNTFTIIEKTRNNAIKRGCGTVVYTGTVVMEHGARATQEFIDALDCSNFGGSVDFRNTDKPNMYTFFACVYID
jgi:hypothetical protein